MFLTCSDSAPKTLTWKMGSPQQDSPIPSGAFVQMWEDTGNYGATAFSSSYPPFEGYCRSSPGRETNEVEYTAYDPTAISAAYVNVFDEDWVDNGGLIQPDSTSVPRVVYNCLNDRDSDWAISKANPFTGQTGLAGLDYDLYGSVKFLFSEVIADLLNSVLLALRALDAAPDGSAAYVSADLDVEPLQWMPQDKIVIQNETIRGAITRLLANYAPAYKLQFRCGDRKWRIYNCTTSTANSYSLNDHTADYPILSFWLDKSLEGRATAVELFGPKNFGLAVYSTADGTLTATDGTYVNYTCPAGGTCTAFLPGSWQITEEADRPGSRILPIHSFVPIAVAVNETLGGGFAFTTMTVPTRSPTLQASWDGGDTFITIPNPYWNFRTGEVSVGEDNWIYMGKSPDYVDDLETVPPDVVRIVYAPYTAPLSVRYPESGYAGTAYDDEGYIGIYRQYHEMLSVGYETNVRYETSTGVPVIGTYWTTDERVEQYRRLAWAIHSQRKDTAWTGGMVLDGIDWDFLNLDRRVNIAGVDADGNAAVHNPGTGSESGTGWDAIGAIVTAVRYDFANQTTTVMFNSNLLEVAGYSVELLMQQLHIRALQRRVHYRQNLEWRWTENKFSWRNAGYYELSGASITSTVEYTDWWKPHSADEYISFGPGGFTSDTSMFTGGGFFGMQGWSTNPYTVSDSFMQQSYNYGYTSSNYSNQPGYYY